MNPKTLKEMKEILVAGRGHVFVYVRAAWLDDLVAEVERQAGEIERLQPIVDAAVTWRRVGHERKDEFHYRIGPLLDAIDVYDVGHKRPCEEL